MEMTLNQHKMYRCPQCGSLNDCSTEVTGDKGPPSDGSVGICFMCGQLMLWQGDNWRIPTAEEKANLDNDPQLTLVRILHAFVQRKPPC
jgi:uncharacterized protein with PIN domain